MTTETQETKLLKVTIDGKETSVKPNTTVIEAARAIGVSIPHFCWHPGLSVAGCCRLCMVKVEGNPKLQISCNLAVTDGMKIDTKCKEVQDAQRWALEFHLVNHPLDCPICDQAGECKLQDYYMKVGRYDSVVHEEKVLKPKALDVGRNLVLDVERCILCARCVRFEDEITKTDALGIFNRGDRSEIGLVPGRRIDHNYSTNLVDICPVGAFTAKDFRFKCRVWFLEQNHTICPGCSTGCNVTVYENKNQREYYRLKPRRNDAVNGFWMCDYGRSMYEHLNAGARLSAPMEFGQNVTWENALALLRSMLATVLKAGAVDKVALVLTPQYTNEEYEAVLVALKSALGRYPHVFIWRSAEENVEDFDGLLFRGDRNPNTAGLAAVLAVHDIKATTVAQDFSRLSEKNPALTIVLGPEILKAYGDLKAHFSALQALPAVCYLGSALLDETKKLKLTLPVKAYAEKSGTFVNFKGIGQKLSANPPVYPMIRGVDEIFSKLVE